MNGPGAVSQTLREDEDTIGFDIVSLVRSAGQLRAGRLAFADDSSGREDSLTFGQFNTLASSYAAALHAFGLQPGERILVSGGTSVRAFAALCAALAAGLDAAIAGRHLDVQETAAFARAIGAAAIVADVARTDSALAEHLLQSAAQADCVRLAVSLDTDPPDGAISIVEASGAGQQKPDRRYEARIITRGADGRPAIHKQQTIVTAGLDFISQAQISAGATIVSTILPASFAGLVCGPVASLLTGAAMVLHAPFDSKRLVARIETEKPVQLIVPAAIAAHLAAAPFLSSQSLATLVFLSRFDDIVSDLSTLLLPKAPGCSCAVTDLLAFGETAVFAERRDIAGASKVPLARNHTIQMDGREIVAIRAVRHLLDTNGVRSARLTFEGAAVSKPDRTYHEHTA
ncbi:MAG: AMP-binding protein [Beijerinckiaceae bacterium]